MPKMIPTKQSPADKSAPKVNYAVGSGSRPTGSKIPIQSSAPKSAKNLRG